jgi:hypothetical protein
MEMKMKRKKKEQKEAKEAKIKDTSGKDVQGRQKEEGAARARVA